MQLNHVSLTVTDRRRSFAFYREHFGMTKIVFEEGDLTILESSDGAVLALSEGDPIAGSLPRENHFGFRLPDAAGVHAARERFRAAGIPETEWQDDGTFTRVQIADPDGYRVELYHF